MQTTSNEGLDTYVTLVFSLSALLVFIIIIICTYRLRQVRGTPGEMPILFFLLTGVFGFFVLILFIMHSAVFSPPSSEHQFSMRAYYTLLVIMTGLLALFGIRLKFPSFFDSQGRFWTSGVVIAMVIMTTMQNVNI